jgi:hypothetical protein
MPPRRQKLAPAPITRICLFRLGHGDLARLSLSSRRPRCCSSLIAAAFADLWNTGVVDKGITIERRERVMAILAMSSKP